MSGHLLGVDVGGTFTDAALVAAGRLFTAKVPTTPSDQSEGVMTAIDLVLERAGAVASEVGRFVHGMTVATNALLEERGARTALLATEGFTDVIEIARQTRPELYDLCRDRPSPLVPPELRFPVRERVEPRGVTLPLDERFLEPLLERLEQQRVESVAISLLHSYADPRHEQRVAAAVAERLPDVHVSASHDVLSVFREYERTSTTVADAYLSPLLRRYLERLARQVSAAGLPDVEVMQSNGGVMSADAAGTHAVWTVLSGPAGGAVGAAYAGRLAGSEDVLSFDMGGTSCDVGVVDAGQVRQTPERTIAGRVLQLPMVDVHTVGAGGGSIAWIDAGGALRVGPRSAGAKPGPASYGAGGTEPTVTDANLLLGYLDSESSLAGGMKLDRAAASRALATLAEQAGLGLEEAATGIARVADQEMLRALRVVTVERGVDPRSYALVAFGGAGPMHAARIADELGLRRVLCPRAAGVLSALGLMVADRRRDVARSVLLSGRDLREDTVQAVLDELVREARRDLPEADIEVAYDVRYRGQAFELALADVERPDPELLRHHFDRAHEERYAYSDPRAELELVNVRVAAVLPGGRLSGAAAVQPSVGAPRGSRRAFFDGGWLEASVIRGEPAPGDRFDGPAVCELPEATVVVPPRWHAEVLDDGALALERQP
jgi:N-methylhydantoinase A